MRSKAAFIAFISIVIIVIIQFINMALQVFEIEGEGVLTWLRLQQLIVMLCWVGIGSYFLVELYRKDD